jgi:hypothetical protein
LRAKAITHWKIGIHLFDGDPEAADEAHQLLEAAHSDLSRLGLPEADV